jgi:hypothetical protein
LVPSQPFSTKTSRHLALSREHNLISCHSRYQSGIDNHSWNSKRELKPFFINRAR